VKGELANFKVPKRVWFMDELPRNQRGRLEFREEDFPELT